METLRATFSPLTGADYTAVFDLQNNQNVREYLGGAVTKEKFDEKFTNYLAAIQPEQYWIVREKRSGSFVGFVSISKYHDNIHYEVSYEIHPTFWGKGYGTEIVDRIITHAFEAIGMHELYAETQEKNIASVKLLEKIGMSLVGEVERFGERQLIYSIRNRL